MSSGTMRTWSPMSRSRTWSTRSSRSRPTSSTRCSLVESNFQVIMPETPMLPEVHVKPRERSRGREITINETPMMLLPKARLRESLDIYNSVRHSYGVVEDTSTQGLHLSTIPSVYSMERRHPPKSALKSGRRSSASRSEADSGIGSLKRAVTFDNLSRSQSTVFKSDDDSDNLSDESDEDQIDADFRDIALFRTIDFDGEDLPEHLDTFAGENEQLIANFQPYPPRPPSRNSSVSINRKRSGYKRRKHRHGNGNDACEICGTLLSERERVEKSFGKVDSFLKWVMSKWGPRRELQYIPRPTYVYRGHTPHFCNFVHQAHLHSKQLKETTDSTGIPDSELDDDLDYIESFEGRLVGKYRKGSNSSLNSSTSGSVNGLVPLPHLEDYYPERVQEDIQTWLSGKKMSRGLFLRYFSSIPEIKEDLAVSGTEGRPGSPSSLDGDSQNDGGDGHRLPVTGVEVKVTTPVKSEPSTKSSVLSEVKPVVIDKSLYGTGDKLIIPEAEEGGDGGKDPEPPTTTRSSDSRRKSIDKNALSVGGDKNSNTVRDPSPSRPPPSPEPVPLPVNKPKPPDTPKPKKRGCITKKTRKPIERVRKMKEPEEAPTVEEPDANPIDPDSEKPDSKLELKVPELPSSADTEKRSRKEKSKPKRHLIEVEDEQSKTLDPIELLNEQNRQIRSEIDWSTMDTNGSDDTNKRQTQIKSWIQGRLALSQQASRFELPMDMKKLENMTPQEYVKKYCIITSRRYNLYQKIFLKNKEKSQTIVFKDLDKTLKEVLVNTITSDQIQDILKLLDVDEQTKVDFKLFAGMAAYAERVLYPKYVTEDTVDMPEYQKEKIECADFSALDWKFHGVNVNPQIKTLLKQIS